jgi:hypothetical protein
MYNINILMQHEEEIAYSVKAYDKRADLIHLQNWIFATSAPLPLHNSRNCQCSTYYVLI